MATLGAVCVEDVIATMISRVTYPALGTCIVSVWAHSFRWYAGSPPEVMRCHTIATCRLVIATVPAITDVGVVLRVSKSIEHGATRLADKLVAAINSI